MGEVYRARDTRLGRDVAIKVLPQHLARASEDRARFAREAKTISALNHPHICTLHDIGREGDTDYLVMELLEGETLAQRLSKGPLPTAEVLRIGAEIADALDRAHRAGVVHRDLKPGNVMLTKAGAKLLDFGLARGSRPPESGPVDVTATAPGFAQQSDEPITAKGTVVGTYQYMAPEQLEGKRTDPRSDIWSLGCVLYEMATGKRAFQGATAISVISAIMKDQPRRMTELVPITPPTLERLVFECLAKDPEERWQTTADLKRELLWIRQEESRAESRPHKRHRGSFNLPILGAATLIVALSAFLVARGRLPAADQPQHFTSLTFKPLAMYHAAFAPDGRSVLFSGAEQGTSPRVFIIRPEYPEPQPITPSDVHLLSVSSKGELAVLTGAASRYGVDFWGTLAVMPLGGGAPRAIAERVVGADWLPDGSQLAIIRDVGERDQIELPLGVPRYTTGGLISELRVSPRGERIAYLEHPVRNDARAEVWIMDRRGQRKQLTFEGRTIEGLTWSHDGSELLFSSDPGGGQQYSIYAVRMGGSLRHVMEVPGSLIIQDVSRDGRWLVRRDENRISVFVHRPEWSQDHDLSWFDNSHSGYLTDNGESIVFTESNAYEGGEGSIVCLRKTDGSPVIKLGGGTPEDISDDGKWVLAIADSSYGSQIVLYPTGAGTTRTIDTRGLHNLWRASFFPGGDSILFSGRGSDGGMRCYVQPVTGGFPRPVTPEGVFHFKVPHHGTSFLARTEKPNPRDEWYSVYDAGTGNSAPVAHLNRMDAVWDWDSNSNTALISTKEKGRTFNDVPIVIQEVDLKSGRRKPYRVLDPPESRGLQSASFSDVTPDRRTYAYHATWKRSSLYVVEPVK